ncbi:pentapeptide repeat-containing protein [Gabonia massiliensis]|uniref:pentapeptide repeat-containing protein n=1 Tax=Gabonia massiliensis TaxID=1686296 RepID=UPI0006D79E2B|nr:pentapeptide repeat-containing protein [Gabonia massiliensis]
MKTKIEIKSIFGNVLFSFEKENNTIKDTLEDAYLRGAYLRGAYLAGANLAGANLRGADLADAYLRGVNLGDADLRGANLINAYLRCANLVGADLRGTDLRGANLINAYLRDANLRGANLAGANLRGTNLRGTNLADADYSEYTSFLSLQCPIEGSFIGWKKCCGYIVKLKICEDAERSSSTSLKCRCSKAEVLEIQNLDGSVADITEICSNYDKNFIYKVGETVEVKNFDKCRWNECSTGIHFFIDREIAKQY